MRRVLCVVLFVALLTTGCDEEKKPPTTNNGTVPKASDVFDKGTGPKGAKKGGPSMG